MLPAIRDVFGPINRQVIPLVETGIAGPPPLGAGLVVLETVGRRSGLPRRVPLLATRAGSRVVVTTVRTNSQWVRNAEADPTVRVWVGGRVRDGVASVCRGRVNVTTVTLSPDGAESAA